MWAGCLVACSDFSMAAKLALSKVELSVELLVVGLAACSAARTAQRLAANSAESSAAKMEPSPTEIYSNLNYIEFRTYSDKLP
jgi:hypothetical protein